MVVVMVILVQRVPRLGAAVRGPGAPAGGGADGGVGVGERRGRRGDLGGSSGEALVLAGRRSGAGVMLTEGVGVGGSGTLRLALSLSLGCRVGEGALDGCTRCGLVEGAARARGEMDAVAGR